MEPRPAPHRILSLSVIGGFLDGLELSFGPGLNTIIGARGTGKTTAIEFIGYALDSLPSREHAADERKRIETLVKRNLGGGRINEAHRLKSLRDRETRSLRQLRELVGQYRDALQSQAGVLATRSKNLVDPEVLKGPNGDILQTVLKQLVACSRDVDGLIGQAVQRIEKAGGAIGEQTDVIAQRHREQELAFRTTIEKHKQAQQQAAERTELERRRNQLLARQQQQIDLQKQVAELSLVNSSIIASQLVQTLSRPR